VAATVMAGGAVRKNNEEKRYLVIRNWLFLEADTKTDFCQVFNGGQKKEWQQKIGIDELVSKAENEGGSLHDKRRIEVEKEKN